MNVEPNKQKHMRTITQNICTFEELNPKVQSKVLDENRDLLLQFDWWRDTISEDARGTAELRIIAFDFHPHRHIEAGFVSNAKSSALRVISEHGNTCATYSIAKKFLSDLESLERKEDTAQTEAEIEELEGDYLEALSEAYLRILEQEEQDLMSDEAIAEHMSNNNYEFLEDGTRYRSK
jgi:hypothetical protein